MPFTFSHPAFILPLLKIRPDKISASGLIMGSMAPDFEYFIHMEMYREHGHTFWGAFYYCLPLTFICCLLFHWLVRDELINNLPKFMQKKYLQFAGMNWLQWVKKYWFVFIYSSLIGIASHSFVDAFTHSNGYFVERVSWLQGEIDILGRLFPISEFLQIFTTLFGAGFIVLILVMPEGRKFDWSGFLSSLKYYMIVLMIAVAVLMIRGVTNDGEFIVTAISGGLIGLILTPFVLKLFRSKR